MRKLLATATVSAVLATGGIAVAGAVAEPDGTAPASEGTDEGRLGGRRGHAIREAAGVAAETIGVGPEELRDAVRDGQTVGEVATEHGVDPTTVVDAIVADATDRIDQAVADGRLDADRAETMKDRLPDLADRLVNSLPQRHDAREGRPGGRRGHAIREAAGVAAETIGVEPEELRDAVRDGQTVGEVATEHGVDPTTVVDAIVADATDRIDQAVADGRLLADRAETMKDRLPDLADRLVNSLPQRA